VAEKLIFQRLAEKMGGSLACGRDKQGKKVKLKDRKGLAEKTAKPFLLEITGDYWGL